MGGSRIVRVVPTEELDAATRASVIQICVAAHGDDDFHQLFSFIRSGGRHVLAFDGARLVSHAVVTERWAQPPGHPPLRTAYVDAVATAPDEQARGHGSAVMRMLAEEVGHDFALGCLETDRPEFYRRLGWELWRGPLAGRRADGSLIPTPEQAGVMVLRLPATPALDLVGLLTIEDQGARIW